MESKKKIGMTKQWGSGFLTLGNVKDIVVLCLLVVVTWKLINSEISITLESFSFTDLLSVLLAFFAISLSAAFYFKATDTSNQFYDNSYKFTKEMSEILGRIEAGFGEKLQHIDDGYSGLRDKFDQMPFNVKEVEEEKKKEERHIKEQEDERDQIIMDLIEKAKVVDGEKEQLLASLDSKNKELDKSKVQLGRISRAMETLDESSFNIPINVVDIVLQKMNDVAYAFTHEGLAEAFAASDELIGSGALDEKDMTVLRKNGIFHNNQLTPKGHQVIKYIFRGVF